MAILVVRNNIIMFFISMALILVLALGMYASNRLLARWFLVRAIEISFLPHEQKVRNFLPAFEDERQTTKSSSKLFQLRLLSFQEGRSNLTSNEINELRSLHLYPNGQPVILDAVVSIPAVGKTTGEITKSNLGVEWLRDELLLSRTPLLDALRGEASTGNIGIYPDMTWWGEFGENAIVSFRPAENRREQPTMLLLVNQSQILSRLSPLNWWISATVCGLSLMSVFCAVLLLWMRFREQIRTNKDVQYLAHHDVLTGLPNRAVFNARLTEALRLAHAKASNIGVLLIDVDKFKEINDTHGHGTGDVFLQIIGERLRAVFSAHLVARLSGDEFAVLLTTVSDSARMTRLASELIAATGAPCVINGKDIKISLSIGLARASDGAWRSSRILHCADLALYKAKHSGRSTFAWYTASLDADAQKRKDVEKGLNNALKYGQFELVYQPQYGLKDGMLRGYEALIRWNHPEKGRITPDIFIPVAEDTGQIQEIGTWVLNQACKEAAMWENEGRKIAVNVSPAQFIAGETQSRVAQALHNSHLDPKRLEIEVTESLLISNPDAVIETLRDIHSMGVSIAMDDFGTGYSSLSYLSLFPFDKIKIDKTFIQNLGKDTSTDAIVTSIIGLGRSLDVEITAEGVETKEQAILLSAAGCDLVQGYMFGKPGSVAQHEAAFPVFPLSSSDDYWFSQKQSSRRA
ncbi:MAG: EAL domain-containing protein [Roseibium sp.]|uniref:putative bifunctional diguanylate cyclase/phosphodiesterase n=1 Tax=Roseibium sp. TaxID=1936156 RepID=UPI0026391BAA|nr:EAL domain-containing protein [Roseibium sp.]MCV0427250.1 EAL domain-containing protein [Roseibium sp.]